MESNERDEDMKRAMKRDGRPTIAPKGTYGCYHLKMLDMKKILNKDYKYYKKEGRRLANVKCAGVEGKCKYNCSNKMDWPIKKIAGDSIVGYWCPWEECKTVYCAGCGNDRVQKELDCTTNSGRRSTRKRGSTQM